MNPKRALVPIVVHGSKLPSSGWPRKTPSSYTSGMICRLVRKNYCRLHNCGTTTFGGRDDYIEL